jgi:uncharacterized repeat protein (TIGR03803 family)
MQDRAGAAYHVLYTFRGRHGSGPYAGLIDVNGALYGITAYGGTYGGGTLFKMTTSGKETVLNSFFGVHGALPSGGLIDVNGRLYGTTELGGRGGDCSGDRCGTVFSITTSGKEAVLHDFGGSPDGAEPEGALIDVKGTFYGTTLAGGAYDEGTVFSITRSGKESVLHSFVGGAGDGFDPRSGLVNVNGALYGTTQFGGAHTCGGPSISCGAVFSITTSGKETVVHSFSGTDGEAPTAGLIDVDGMLYGTTDNGGSGGCGGSGCGTVFSMTTSGKESVIHSFSGGDGAQPWAGLIDVNGTLYGTTVTGGSAGSGCAYVSIGCGTVFSITTSGKETVLHSFGNYGDGIYPYAGLLNVKGTLYGTTPYTVVSRGGIVFSLKR